MISFRKYTKLDLLIMAFDNCLQLSQFQKTNDVSSHPDESIEEPDLNKAESTLSSQLMRVNHSGEVCAQALYLGQALFTKDPHLQQGFLHSAEEEKNHLAWCHKRLENLHSRPSFLNPLWGLGSFALGAIASLAGDGYSLGFLEETENQVTKHLRTHLRLISPKDLKSRAILDQMILDENHHAEYARQQGAIQLPSFIKQAMQYTSKILTYTARYV